MSQWLGNPLACSINMRGGARGNRHAYTPPRENPSRHLLLAKTWNPNCVRGASTPTCGVSSPYVWTLWRRYCSAGQLWWYKVATRMRTWSRWWWSTTSCTLTRDYVRPLLQFFFCCAACLVVTIHDILLACFLGWHGSSTSVAYPYHYSGIRAILCSS
jgi:hypothetical protein